MLGIQMSEAESMAFINFLERCHVEKKIRDKDEAELKRLREKNK